MMKKKGFSEIRIDLMVKTQESGMPAGSMAYM